MTTSHPHAESYKAFAMVGRIALRVPVATRTAVTRIIGGNQVEGVEVEDLDTGDRRIIDCDTVIFTGDWIPDHELARAAEVDMDAGTRGPQVDRALRTSAPGIFAIGNLVHPVDTADIAALDGDHVAESVARHLRSEPRPTGRIGVRVESPLRWISPNALAPDDPVPTRRRYLLWTDELVRIPKVTVRQGGVVLATRILPWPASPGRTFRIPASMLRRADALEGDVTVSLSAWPRCWISPR